MMSATERAIVRRLIRVCRREEMVGDAEIEAAVKAAEALLPKLRWSKQVHGTWKASYQGVAYTITHDRLHSRSPYWIYLGAGSTGRSGSLPTLQQAKAYCERNARGP